MENKYEQDEILLEKIKRDDQLVIKTLHIELWPSFSAFISSKRNLNFSDILDLYNKSFTALYFNIKNEKLTLPLRSSLKTYLFGIGKNYLFRFLDEAYHQREEQIDNWDIIDLNQIDDTIDDYYDKMYNKDLVIKLLNQLDTSCQELLKLSFVKSYSDEAIANKMGIPSQGAVRQKRFSCLEKIRKFLKNSKSDS